MKLELRENMYIRNCYGRIAKIEYIEDNIAYCDNWLYQSYEDHITFINLNDEEDINEILKASYNIIDILEVGDIIRYRIDKVSLETKGYLTGVIDIADEEMLKSIKEDKNYHVLQILTKEKFKEMSYEIVEKNKII